MNEKLVEYLKNTLIKAGKVALLAGATVFVTEVGETLQIVPDDISPEAKAGIALISGVLIYIGGYLGTLLKE